MVNLIEVTYYWRMGVVVRFCCVPAHSGVEGNEIVDQLAKRALKLDIIYINVPLGRGEAKCKIRAILIDVGQKRWDSELKGQHLYALQIIVVDQDSKVRLGRNRWCLLDCT